mmetsp:Transcript_28535/g.46248  ORF Transcript_28535/g.46248 Transcript_28535/m.46248 type:complete len:503 (-) Transcript_28535:203-1711(-)|eukprot:CAMPEP_0184649006 /NCGR_PEP_ID=MMETSP0308-20130426/6282_1 /TAXON_ID=38269 /ORGANISM="Gloeochaete witrockiana, Strain SAG 46.84" /LENGTH=502 /DNA_ID=CAMNT_0027081387 /DNA_START=109 /DNA_END=1617 /DNA_ORIENTATION=+
MKVAVIGSGISGTASGWMLSLEGHEVVMYEKDDWVGGHSHTVDVPRARADGDQRPAKQAVDTGFIVYNELCYPHLTRAFARLGVETEPSDMSFSVSVLEENGIEWAGDTLQTVFAQRRNLFSPSFWNMIVDFLRFNLESRKLLSSDCPEDLSRLTLGQFLDAGHYSDIFRKLYLLPMTAAIWSAPMEAMLAFPAVTVVRFMENHRMLNILDRPRWRTVTGGSREYVKKITAPYKHNIKVSTSIQSIRRLEDNKVIVKDVNGNEESYDHVIIASHADQALSMLSDPSEEEQRILSAFQFQTNECILHSDRALMPRDKQTWASWNYLALPTEEAQTTSVSVTYWMNRLQNIDRGFPLFLSLNPVRRPQQQLIHGTYMYDHPLFSKEAIKAQGELTMIQGPKRTWFCGAWCGYGFHEDGFAAAYDVIDQMGVPLPWSLPELHQKRRAVRDLGQNVRTPQAVTGHFQGHKSSSSVVGDMIGLGLSLTSRILQATTYAGKMAHGLIG